jgi:hypothetical protein
MTIWTYSVFSFVDRGNGRIEQHLYQDVSVTDTQKAVAEQAFRDWAAANDITINELVYVGF